MKLVFLTPGDNFTGGFYDSLLATIGSFFGKYDFTFIREYSSDIYNCRESIVRELFKLEYDWAVWIDSDMVWKPDDIEKLIGSGVDVVSALCMIDLYRTNAAVLNDEGIGYLNAWRARELGELVRVDLVGLGFLAIRKGVMESLEEPLFRSGTIQVGAKSLVASEDMLFVDRLRRKGYGIYVRTDVMVGHQKRVTLKPFMG